MQTSQISRVCQPLKDSRNVNAEKHHHSYQEAKHGRCAEVGASLGAEVHLQLLADVQDFAAGPGRPPRDLACEFG